MKTNIAKDQVLLESLVDKYGKSDVIKYIKRLNESTVNSNFIDTNIIKSGKLSQEQADLVETLINYFIRTTTNRHSSTDDLIYNDITIADLEMLNMTHFTGEDGDAVASYIDELTYSMTSDPKGTAEELNITEEECDIIDDALTKSIGILTMMWNNWLNGGDYEGNYRGECYGKYKPDGRFKIY